MGGLVAAVNDCLFFLRWLSDANSLIMLLLEIDNATGILSNNAGGHKIVEKMRAYIAAYNFAIGRKQP